MTIAPPPHVYVAVSDVGAPPVKLLKLLLATDGSIGIIPAYHPAKEGGLELLGPVEPDPETPGLGFAPTLRAYRTDQRVKLHVHASRFVQYSAAGGPAILSGSDPTTGAPRGFGVTTPDLTDPITTGPTFLARFFDVSVCEALQPRDLPQLVFEEGDFVERTDYLIGARRVYTVEGFILPATVRSLAIPGPRGDVVRMSYSTVSPDWLVDFRIVDLARPSAVLGILVSREAALDETRHGYTLGSGRDKLTGQSLAAVYPLSEWGYKQDELEEYPMYAP